MKIELVLCFLGIYIYIFMYIHIYITYNKRTKAGNAIFQFRSKTLKGKKMLHVLNYIEDVQDFKDVSVQTT